jgi:hypothetical protein
MSDHPLDQLEAFALGDLEPAAAQSVLDHADGCPVCAPILAEAMKGVAAIAQADGTRAAAVSNFARPAKRRRIDSGWWAAAAATAAAIALAGWNLQLRSNAPVVSVVPIAALVHSHFTHHPLHGTGGDAKLLQALDGSWVYFVADGLHGGATYELDVDGTKVGDVKADRTGSAAAFFARPPKKITSASLTGGGVSLRWP